LINQEAFFVLILYHLANEFIDNQLTDFVLYKRTL